MPKLTIAQAADQTRQLMLLSDLCAKFIEDVSEIEDRAHNNGLREVERYAKRVADAVTRVAGGRLDEAGAEGGD